MDKSKLIGMRVMDVYTHAIGIIKRIEDGRIEIDFHGEMKTFLFPSVFASSLELEDEELQEEIQNYGIGASFDSFRKAYKSAIGSEIKYLRATGGKKYRIVDGERLPSRGGEYLYAFDTDTDLSLPDGTVIKLWFPDNIVTAYIINCEDFTITFRSMEFIGESLESVEFTSEQWQLLEALEERLDEMEPSPNSIAYEIACNGRKQITQWQSIRSGQNLALNRATSEQITFIWGPPGTGKTETLANIAIEHIKNSKRVLMLSYSNVSVDGAILRVAKKADFEDGQVIRYGYPKTRELVENPKLNSYQYVLHKNSDLASEYRELQEQKKRLKKKDSERAEINKRLAKIRDYLSEQEKELIQMSAFVATTVSKATMDRAVYSQRFDVVIFDEASMAYVPQIVFSAGLAKSHFVCMGDFCQLPAIVQNPADNRLEEDIFEYTGITEAVDNDEWHEWLVMLDLQYRMHHDIADFVSENMYYGKLKTSDRIYQGCAQIASYNPCPDSAMALIDLSGIYSVCSKTMDGSRINILSALFCLRMAEKYIDKYEVGIITPYSAQSRLILSMIRDIQEYDKRWEHISCATVHQFQGSEKPVIIYDAVDCFRMPYPGTLLTSQKNDTANRLFNVAMTRSKGKFVMVSNIDFMKRKNISKKLMFSKAMAHMSKSGHCIKKGFLLDELMPEEKETPIVYIEDRDTSWKQYIDSINTAKRNIHIDIPDVIDENDDEINELITALNMKSAEGVGICIRKPDEIDLPEGFNEYIKSHEYVSTPVTIIDNRVVWFGHPLYAADFISEGEILDTEYFPCIRFIGYHATKSIKAFLEI